MDTKFFNYISFLLLLFSLTGCPSVEDCNDNGRILNVPNLVQVSPLQTDYNQGDIITFSLEIPRVFQGIDLLEETGDREGSCAFGGVGDNILNSNDLQILIGSTREHENWFYLPFDVNSNSYKLEFTIQLNNIGEYSFDNSAPVDFIGENCNRYFIDTTIAGANANHMIAFTVH